MMSPIDRPLADDVMVFDLKQERDRIADPASGEPGGRGARTLLKSGPLRVTMVVLAPGATTAEHRAEGPITIQPLQGQIRFTAESAVRELGPGELLCAGAGIPHAVASAEGAAFLLTIVKAP
jgi:quercetin dioxygenase-like cupin family protein